MLHAPCGEDRLAANPTAIVALLATTASFIESETHSPELIMYPSLHTFQIFVVFTFQVLQLPTSHVSTIPNDTGLLNEYEAKTHSIIKS